MTIDYSIPLTPEQAEMVTENHDLIYAFLHKHKLPMEDYYDLAAWGLVRAAQAWYQSEYVRQFAFSTIAFNNMFFITMREDKISKRHNIDAPIRLDATLEDRKEPAYSFIPCPRAAAAIDQLLDEVEVKAMLKQLTPEQRYLLLAHVEGQTQTDLARQAGTTQVTIGRRIRKAKAIIRDWYEKEAAV